MLPPPPPPPNHWKQLENKLFIETYYSYELPTEMVRCCLRKQISRVPFPLDISKVESQKSAYFYETAKLLIQQTKKDQSSVSFFFFFF